MGPVVKTLCFQSRRHGFRTKVLHGKTQPKTDKTPTNKQTKQRNERRNIYHRPHSDVCPAVSNSLRPHGQRSLAGYSPTQGSDLHWQADSSPLSHLGSPMDAPRSHPDEHGGTVPAPNHSAVGEDVTAELCWPLHKPNVPSFPGLACEAWSLLPTAQ